MKKIVSILIAIILTANFPYSALASSQYEYTDTSVLVYSPEAMAVVFSTQVVDIARYSYSLSQRTTLMESQAYVNFELHINGTIYSGQASGTVFGYTIGINTLWLGPIEGYIEIGDINYPITVGFAKMSGSDDIQFSISCKVPVNGIEQFLLINMGEKVLTSDIYNELNTDYSQLSSVSNSGSDVAPCVIIDDGIVGDRPIVDGGGSTTTNPYVEVGRTIGYLEDYDILIGGETAAYFDETNNRLVISVQSYVSSLNYCHNSIGRKLGSEIVSISYNLERGEYEPESYSYIVGMELFEFQESNFDTTSAQLLPLFEDILGVLGVPTSTISSVIDSLTGEVSKTEATNASSFEVRFPFGSDTNLDNLSAGLPIVFQLSKGTDNYVGGSIYTITTQIRYRTTVVFDTPDDIPYFYIDDSQEMTFDIEVTLQ